MTLMFDSGVILWGEIRSWSLLGVKGLRLEKGPLDNKFRAPAIKPAFLHEFLTVPHDSPLFSDCLSLLLWFWSHDTNWNTLTIALNIVFDNIVACRAGVIVASECSEFYMVEVIAAIFLILQKRKGGEREKFVLRGWETVQRKEGGGVIEIHPFPHLPYTYRPL